MERQSMNISQWVWWVERDSVLLAYYSEATDKFTSPSEVKKVTLFYIQRPDKFLIVGESPERDGFSSGDTYLGVALDSNTSVTSSTFWEQECEIPEQFHEALIARVVANGYERKPETLQLATYFLEKYEAGVKECRKYSFRGRDGSTIQPMTQDF
jgi:hypothetical protein